MSIRDQNPFIDADLQLIITSFEKMANSSQTEDSVYPLVGSVVARVKTSALASIEDLQTYLNKPERKPENGFLPDLSLVFGEANPSLTAEPNPDGPQPIKPKGFLGECFPCDFRPPDMFDALPDFSIFEDFFSKDLDYKEGLFDSLSDLMNTPAVYDDLCVLLQALKSNCVPDLARLVAILSFLLSKMSTQQNTNVDGIFSLLLNLFSPTLNGLASLLDKFSFVVSTPLECLVQNLELQYGRIQSGRNLINTAAVDITTQVSPGLNSRQRATSQQTQSRIEQIQRERSALTGSPPIPRLPDFNASDIQQASQFPNASAGRGSPGYYILKLKEYTQEGIKKVNDFLTYYLDQLREFLKLESDHDTNLTDFLRMKQELTRMIGIIKALLSVAVTGQIKCGSGEKITFAEIENFGNIFANPRTGFSINPDGEVTITLGPRTESPEPDNIRVIKVKSCLKSVDKVDLSKVSLWMKELDSAFPDTGV